MKLSFYRGLIVWGGDFNCILNQQLDRSAPRKQPLSNMSKTLNKNLKDIGLCEIWRMMHSTKREYSYYSQVHNSYSRIDFFMLNITFKDCILECNYLPRIISDHFPLLLTIRLKIAILPSRACQLNTMLLADPNFVEFLNTQIDIFYQSQSEPG